MHRLASKILGLEPIVRWPSFKERCLLHRGFVLKSPRLILDDIAEMYATHPNQSWDCSTDIPNWAPPWKHFFAEWEFPERWVMPQGEVMKESFQQGLTCLVLQVTDDNVRDRDMWSRFLSLYANFNHDGLRGKQVDMLELLDGARWILACELWMSANARPILGLPVWPGVVYLSSIDPKGKLLKNFQVGPAIQMPGYDAGNMMTPLHVLGLGLSFCNCKNVEVGDVTIPGIKSTSRRDTERPTYKYHVLNVRPMKKILNATQAETGSDFKRAMHICRGHFSRYGEDKPLFGKYVGDFWIPDHVRGSAKLGTVDKDYKAAT